MMECGCRPGREAGTQTRGRTAGLVRSRGLALITARNSSTGKQQGAMACPFPSTTRVTSWQHRITSMRSGRETWRRKRNRKKRDSASSIRAIPPPETRRQSLRMRRNNDRILCACAEDLTPIGGRVWRRVVTHSRRAPMRRRLYAPRQTVSAIVILWPLFGPTSDPLH